MPEPSGFVRLVPTIVQLALLGIPVLCIYFAWRLLRAYESRGRGRGESSDLEGRVAQLEATVAELSVDSDRTAEERRC